MSDKQKPLVSAAELEALIQDWGAGPNKLVDKFYPLRCGYIFALTFFYCIWLLFWTDSAVHRMTSDPAEMVRIGRFLYFRGWFIAVIMMVGLYAYLANWYPAIVFGGLLLVTCVNFVFDLFNVYAEVIAHPTPRTTLMLILRLIALWFVYLNVKNSSRFPDTKDRMNVLLMFRKGV